MTYTTISESELLEKAMPCMKCGLCRASCPVFTEHQVETSVARSKVRLIRGILQREFELDEDIASRIYLCLLCRQCTTTCPSGVSVNDIVSRAREALVERGFTPSSMLNLSRALAEVRNITGEPASSRTLWMDDLQKRPKTGKAEVIYYTGCVAALFPTVWSIPQALVQVFDKAGLDFAVLGGDEWCCGYPMIGGGITSSLRQFIDHNIEALSNTGAHTMVTGCPSCYHTFSSIYPEITGSPLPFSVVHSTQFIGSLVDQDLLRLGRLEETVTYHDPCDLGRKSGVYEPPRSIIKKIPGVTFKEMAKAKDAAICCGGGGNLEMLFPDTTQAVSKRKVQQAKDTGASVVASACQQCKRTMTSAVRKEKAKVKVLDVAELVLRSIQVNEG